MTAPKWTRPPGRWIDKALPAEPPDLLPGLLPERGTAGIVGETNVGKSLVACEIAATLVTGRPLWGAITPVRTLDRVVYILGEHSERTIRRLYKRLRLPKTRKIWLIGPEDLYPSKALIMNGIVQRDLAQRLARYCEGAGLVIFDPLAGFVAGMQEADNVGMRLAIETMGGIAGSAGASCLILAHMGKPVMTPLGEMRRSSYAMRGASAQEDALTHVFYLEHANREDRFRLRVRKLKGESHRLVYDLERSAKTLQHRVVEPGAWKREGAASGRSAQTARAKVRREDWIAVFQEHLAKGLSTREATLAACADLDVSLQQGWRHRKALSS